MKTGAPALVKIWSRPSEWNYRWTNRLSVAETILCSIHEHSRYALACLPEQFSFPRGKEVPFSALPHLLGAADTNILGPIFFLLVHYPTPFNFPLDPYRVARKKVQFDPEIFLRELDEFSLPSAPDEIQLPLNATLAMCENILALAQMRKRYPQPAVKRGAGARVRQARTALKYLGALKLRSLMKTSKAIRHTEQALGQPLFSTESQWSRALKAAKANMCPFNAEAAVLLKAFSEKRSLRGFNCRAGKLATDWVDS